MAERTDQGMQDSRDVFTSYGSSVDAHYDGAGESLGNALMGGMTQTAGGIIGTAAGAVPIGEYLGLSSPRTPVKFYVVGGFVQPREVLQFSYKFEQTRDKQGQISAETKGGEIKLTVKASNKGFTDLLQWKLDPENRAYHGGIEFFNTVNRMHMKLIKFENAFCVEYEEEWKEGELAGGKHYHVEKITLACKHIRVDSTVFNNAIRWGV